MSDWRVLVIEDDRTVAGLHCRFVSRVPGFDVAGVADTAAAAERMIGALRPDLLLLDLGLPDENGIGLLRRLRGRGETVEAIVVTAASASNAVRATVHLGVVDYLVKPFDQQRLRQSLTLFRRRMAMLTGGRLAQRDVDRLCSDGPNSYRWLPRDLSEERLAQVQGACAQAAGPSTAAEVASRCRISRVTARRYLEYLVSTGQATTSIVTTGPGRPSKTYALTSDVGAAAR